MYMFEIIFHMIYLCFLSELLLSLCTGNLLEGSASGCEGSSKSVVSARNTRNIGRLVAVFGCSFFNISIYIYRYDMMIWSSAKWEGGQQQISQESILCHTLLIKNWACLALDRSSGGTWCPAANRGYMELPATPLPAAHNVVGEVGAAEFFQVTLPYDLGGGRFLYGGFLKWWYPQIIH